MDPVLMSACFYSGELHPSARPNFVWNPVQISRSTQITAAQRRRPTSTVQHYPAPGRTSHPLEKTMSWKTSCTQITAAQRRRPTSTGQHHPAPGRTSHPLEKTMSWKTSCTQITAAQNQPVPPRGGARKSQRHRTSQYQGVHPTPWRR